MRLVSRDEIAILALVNGIALLTVALTRHFDTRDFDVFYASASQYAQGADPYSGLGSLNTNPPHAVWAMTPLSRLRNTAAYWVWTILSAAAFAWSVLRVSSRCRLPVDRFVLAAIIGNAGTFTHVAGGQVAWMLAALMTEAWLTTRTWISGVLIGVCASVKPFLLLFLPFFVYRRQFGRAAGVIIGLSASVGLGVGVLGTSVYESWAHTLGMLNTAYHAGNGSLFGLLSRLSQPTALSVIGPTAVRICWLALAVIVILTAWRWLKMHRDPAREWSIVLVSALLISPLGQTYYLALVVGPLWIALSSFAWPWWSVGLVGLFWWPNVLTTPEPPTHYWQLVPYAFTCVGVLTLWSMLTRCPARTTAASKPASAAATYERSTR